MSELLRKGFFRLARNVSKYSNHRYKVGAVIAHKKPISVGFNIIKTHPRYSNPNITKSISIHAEASALLKSYDAIFKDSVIYIYRENLKGEPAIARPCRDCMKLLKNYGIKKIYYTIDRKPFWKEEKL